MRTRQEALDYGLSFPNTYQDAPFHDENWQLVRVRKNKKVFLWTYERDGKIMIPVSVQAHHSFIDGLHIGQFVEELQKYFNEW